MTTFIGGIAALAVIAGLVVSLPQRPATRTASTFGQSLRLRAAIVNSATISNADFQRDRAVLKHFIDFGNRQSPDVFRQPTAAEIDQLTLDRLVRNAMVEQLATARRVLLTQAEVDADFNEKLQAAQVSNIEQELRQQFGMGVTEYKQRIVRPFLLMAKLQQSIAFDDTVNAGLTARAQQVEQAVVASKEPFEALVTTYSDDVDSAENGGDLGVRSQADLPPEVYAAALKLKPGERSPLVRSVLGYHIVQLVDAVPTDQGDTPVVHLRQILVRSLPVDAYITAQLSAANVRVFVRSVRWDRPTAAVLAA